MKCRRGSTSLEVRDLLGDGSDCAITKETFREQAQTYGTNLRIRRIADGQFQVLWDVPVEFHNLSQYSPKMQILQPPEQNMGAPGTVTTGEVTFRPKGKGQEPVWKGRWSFFIFSAGRRPLRIPLRSRSSSSRNGQGFAPLR